MWVMEGGIFPEETPFIEREDEYWSVLNKVIAGPLRQKHGFPYDWI